MSTNNISGPSDPFYEPAGFVMLRTPLLPLDARRFWRELPLESPARLAVEDAAPPGLDEVLERDTVAAREHLRALLDDPMVQEAIPTGSPDLFQALPPWPH